MCAIFPVSVELSHPLRRPRIILNFGFRHNSRSDRDEFLPPVIANGEVSPGPPTGVIVFGLLYWGASSRAFFQSKGVVSFPNCCLESVWSNRAVVFSFAGLLEARVSGLLPGRNLD